MHPEGADGEPQGSKRWFTRVIDIRQGELALTLLSAAYFFCLLGSYFLMRPLRDQVGAERAENLKWLFASTLVGMILAQPVYGWLVSRWPRRRFIPWVCRFFALHVLVFFVLLKLRSGADARPIWTAFFVWLSIFNMFVVSVFWSFMADVFRLEQSKRLFGVIAVGGSLGGLVGSALTNLLVVSIGATGVLLIALVFLELATQCMSGVARCRQIGFEDPSLLVARKDAPPEEQERGDIWNGMRLVARSPYLMLIALHFLLLSTLGTVFYFEQSQLVKAGFSDADQSRAFLARIDVWTNAATLVAQLLLTGPVVKRFGIGFALLAQPLFCVLALSALGAWNALAVLVVGQATLRTLQHSATRPAREMLFTVVGREVKYKSKSFIDTFVVRLGDQIGIWSSDFLKGASLSLSAIAWVAVPLALVWCGVAAALGKMQQRIARERT